MKVLFVFFPTITEDDDGHGFAYRVFIADSGSNRICECLYDFNGKTISNRYLPAPTIAAPQPFYSNRDLFDFLVERFPWLIHRNGIRGSVI